MNIKSRLDALEELLQQRSDAVRIYYENRPAMPMLPGHEPPAVTPGPDGTWIDVATGLPFRGTVIRMMFEQRDAPLAQVPDSDE